jgi:hypothetical protein
MAPTRAWLRHAAAARRMLSSLGGGLGVSGFERLQEVVGRRGAQLGEGGEAGDEGELEVPASK